ncbi:MAG TPA: VCBS repeat-containing protein, partial [candidate division Zixibacteria bacterium]|nr:VCBS repeat-containing protein [candidate division Zixibacteria bacterium]
GGQMAQSTELHGNSFINFSDFDDDSDLDLFFGDIFNLSVYLFQNEGTAQLSDLTLITEDFLNFNTRGFNHPVFADLDNDDDKDMILGVAQNANLDNLRFLRNESGSFIEETKNLISQFDLGNDSKPALADLDNDGDIDMLVGGNLGKLRYFENTGNSFSPAFETDTAGFQGMMIGSYSAPALVDWDSDNDLDLLIGNVNGRIEYWRNDGDASNFVATLVTNQMAALINDTLKVIKVDQLAVPCPADLNNDGLIDLVLGEWDFNGLANVLLFENTGTIGNPVLNRVTNRFIKVLDQNGDTLYRDFTVPMLHDWDEDGKKDLIIGGRYGGLTLYLNTAATGQLPDSSTLIKSADIIPGADAGQYLAIAFADIDNDSDDDVFVGESSGGINFYRAFSSACCVGIRGDFNNDGMDATVLDLNFLVNDIFRGGPSPVCSDEADLNGDGNPSTILDLNYLVNDIFRGGPSPLGCP